MALQMDQLHQRLSEALVRSVKRSPVLLQVVSRGGAPCLSSLICLPSSTRTQAEMAHTCRGTINLASATVDTLDSCSFVIGKGGTQTYYLRAANEVDRQKWVTALGLAQAKAIKMLESSGTQRIEIEIAGSRSHTSAPCVVTPSPTIPTNPYSTLSMVVGRGEEFVSLTVSHTVSCLWGTPTAGFCPHGSAWVGPDPHSPIADPYY